MCIRDSPYHKPKRTTQNSANTKKSLKKQWNTTKFLLQYVLPKACDANQRLQKQWQPHIKYQKKSSKGVAARCSREDCERKIFQKISCTVYLIAKVINLKFFKFD